MKQKIITSAYRDDLKSQIEVAISFGWFVQTIAGSDTGWVAILIKDEQ